MDDLIEDTGPGDNAPEFTVSEISGAVKRSIEGEFSIVRVRGEIGRVSRPRSGHVYLDLKDDRAVLAGVIWKGAAARMVTQPEEGLEVVAVGRLTTFPGQSKYQIVIESISPAGVGALMAMLEKRKKALEAEGLFDTARKKPLPYLPDVIGVVTSPSGAVIRDILHRLRDRFPRRVLIWPVAVQGERSAGEVAAAIRGFNALTAGGGLPRPDLLIVARGGGSIEDLWGFNEEIVARATYESEIPLISAVGHETDTTLIDYVADRRAPTPSAAAEMAVPVRLELLAWTQGQGERLTRGLLSSMERRRQRTGDLSRLLPRPEALLSGPRQKLDLLDGRLPGALRTAAQRKRVHLAERGALRPLLLSRILNDRKLRLDRQADRLQPKVLAREVIRMGRDLEGLSSRFFNAMRAAQEGRADRLAAIDRIRQSVGYMETLRRGYAVVRSDGNVITNKSAAEGATDLEIEFQDGRVKVGASAVAPKRRTPKADGSDQGSLF
ncbi:MAG: exodeoxyribonuclease VII large subunit [Pseudomonadota bacterium]